MMSLTTLSGAARLTPGDDDGGGGGETGGLTEAVIMDVSGVTDGGSLMLPVVVKLRSGTGRGKSWIASFDASALHSWSYIFSTIAFSESNSS